MLGSSPYVLTLLQTDFKQILLLENLGMKSLKREIPQYCFRIMGEEVFTESLGKENNLFAHTFIDITFITT